MLGVGFKASAESAGALANELGDVGKVSSEAVVQVASMAKSYGISEQEGAKLFKQMKAISGASDEIVASAMKTTIELARANGVAPGKVMNDIASNTEFFAGFAKKGGENIAQTAVQAAKLGLSLGDVSSMVNSILDVESSIEKEMEASVLLNRQISFDKARQLAMSGDTLGATKAILEQVGGVAEFENMSIMQRKALADAAGVELSVMQQMVSSRESQIEMGLVQESQSEKALKMASGIYSFAKENAEVLGSGVNFLASAKHIKMGTWIKEKAHAAWTWMFKRKDHAQTMIEEKMQSATGGGGTKGASKGAKGGGGGGLMKSMSKMNPGKIIAGAAAMVIVAAAVFVFGKAVQEFMGVSWSAVGMAVVSMLALVGAVALLGVIMSSGVGAIAIIAGAGAMLIVAAAVYVLGKALQEMAKGFDMMGDITSQLLELVVAAPFMLLAAAGFIAMGYGLVALSAGLLLLTPMLPVLMALGGLTAIGMSLSGGDSGAKEGGDNIIAEKLDILIGLIAQGGTINMDGKKVGDVIALAQGPMGA